MIVLTRTSATVSNNMRKIHSKDTSIELLLRKALWHKGYRYRKNYKALPGSPDIVLTKYKIAIFCDSEFFHGKDWEILKLRLEKGKNPDFWIKKIERNRNRDYENDKKLLFLGYTVLHFWGQDISKHTDECLQAIEEAIWDTKFSDTATDYDISDDSEFFHGKDWEILKLRLEKGKNPDFWIKKIERNRNRDYENDKKLLFLGYTVLHFWGQDISKHTDECLQAIEEAIWDTKFSDTATDYDISEE